LAVSKIILKFAIAKFEKANWTFAFAISICALLFHHFLPFAKMGMI